MNNSPFLSASNWILFLYHFPLSATRNMTGGLTNLLTVCPAFVSRLYGKYIIMFQKFFLIFRKYALHCPVHICRFCNSLPSGWMRFPSTQAQQARQAEINVSVGYTVTSPLTYPPVVISFFRCSTALRSGTFAGNLFEYCLHQTGKL